MKRLLTAVSIVALFSLCAPAISEDAAVRDTVTAWRAEVKHAGKQYDWMYFYFRIEKAPVWIGTSRVEGQDKTEFRTGRWKNERESWSLDIPPDEFENATVDEDGDSLSYVIKKHPDPALRNLKVRFDRMKLTEKDRESLMNMGRTAKGRLDDYDKRKRSKSDFDKLPPEVRAKVIESQRRLLRTLGTMLD